MPNKLGVPSRNVTTTEPTCQRAAGAQIIQAYATSARRTRPSSSPGHGHPGRPSLCYLRPKPLGARTHPCLSPSHGRSDHSGLCYHRPKPSVHDHNQKNLSPGRRHPGQPSHATTGFSRAEALGARTRSRNQSKHSILLTCKKDHVVTCCELENEEECLRTRWRRRSGNVGVWVREGQ